MWRDTSPAIRLRTFPVKGDRESQPPLEWLAFRDRLDDVPYLEVQRLLIAHSYQQVRRPRVDSLEGMIVRSEGHGRPYREAGFALMFAMRIESEGNNANCPSNLSCL